jgi:outer membrane immunogenic protein
MRIKHLWSCLALASAVALLGGAARADGPFGQAIVPELKSDYGFVPPFTWTGVYLGGNIGGSWITETLTDSLTGTALHADHSGFMGGVQLGYNFQIRNFVIGAEWDMDWSSISHKGTATAVAPIGTLQESADTHTVTTVAGRVGVVGEQWLAYLKGGGGWVDTRASIADKTTGAVSTVSGNDGGWLFGGGFEYAITAHWITKIEYDFLGLPNRSMPGFLANDSFGVDHNLQMFKVGINYKF